MNFVFLVSVIISLYFFNGNATISIPKRPRCHGKIGGISSSRKRIYFSLDHDVNKTKIPPRFDAREKWPHCKSLFRIMNQGRCGGCWAFSTSSVMSDRLCIHSQQKIQDYVSTQDLLECCKWCLEKGDEYVGGCNGGYAINAFDYWKRDGIVSGFDHPLEGCKPLDKDTPENRPSKTCRKQCTNKEYKKSYNNSKSFGRGIFVQEAQLEGGIEQIQIELMKNGPIVASINIYDDLVAYFENGVMFYNESNETLEGAKFGGHGVKLIGWDVTEDGTPVWIIANSWGDKWCDSGFCRLKRGVNELKIEEHLMVGALPRLPQPASSKRPTSRPTDHTEKINRAIGKIEKIDSVPSGSDTFTFSLSVDVIFTFLVFFS